VNREIRSFLRDFFEKVNDDIELSEMAPEKTAIVSKDIPLCVSSLLSMTEIPIKGNGNKTMLAISSFFKDAGYSKQEAEKRLYEWGKNLTNISNKGDADGIKRGIRGVLDSVYGGDQYRFSCRFIRGSNRDDSGTKVPCSYEECTVVNHLQQEPGNIIVKSLADAAAAKYYGLKVRSRVMISGKDSTPYIVPSRFRIHCPDDIDKRCNGCDYATHQAKKYDLKPSDPELIGCVHTNNRGVILSLKRKAKVPYGCKSCKVEVEEHQNVEEIMLCPDVEGKKIEDKEFIYVHHKALHVGGHNLRENEVYEIDAYTLADPNTQHAMHVFNEKNPVFSTLDGYKMDQDEAIRLSIFQPQNGESVKDAWDRIHKDIQDNVVGFKSPLLLSAIDLVYHSATSVRFMGYPLQRGWSDVLIIGDSGQGKSTLSERIMNHYGLGIMVVGDQARRTGLLYTIQQSSNKRWFLVWGAFALHDRRLIIIDEAKGLPAGDLSQFTGPRSSGIINVHSTGNIASTVARVRTLWLTNTRSGRQLNQYEYPVTAVLGRGEFMCEHEDVRRLDFALGLIAGSMDIERLHQRNLNTTEHKITSYLCTTLLRWIWSRTESQILFTTEAEETILSESRRMCEKYDNSIPLVEPSDQREKIARQSVAVAARVFSCSDDLDKIIVKPEHVLQAVDIMCDCLNTLDYDAYSEKEKSLKLNTVQKEAIVSDFMQQFPDWEMLKKFMLTNKYIKPTYLEQALGYEKVDVRHITKFLNKHQLIKASGQGWMKSPSFIEILRLLP